MLGLDYITQREVVTLLVPLLGSEEERRALLSLALGLHCPVLAQLDFKGATEIFILRLIEKLEAFGKIEPGKPALWALLETVRERVGVDRQMRIDALQPLLNPPSSPRSPVPESAPPAVPPPSGVQPPPDVMLPSPTLTGIAPSTAPLPLRIFLASPGDVADERALTLKVLEQLPYDPLLRGKIVVEIVAWDKQGAGTPLLATLTPQEAIKQGLPKPSECDIVIVIFWSRMGTPLPADWRKPDGSRYLSGTEWEYWDALQTAMQCGKPDILVYRRTEEPVFRPSDAEMMQKIEQWQWVESFFQSFHHPDGSIRQGYNAYAAPADFQQQLELHLRELIRRRLESHPALPPVSSTVPPLWSGSPFPGLCAFTPDDAPIFFGRRRETDGLVQRLANPDTRFLMVVGASGSGKSSLVAAGLIPRLQGAALEGSRDWDWVRFTPGGAGDNPFRALAEALVTKLTHGERRAYDLERQLHAGSEALASLTETVLRDRPAPAELLLFIDQFEELFTVVTPAQREPFIHLLDVAAQTRRLRLVATVRADFYACCVEFPALAERLRSGSYPLAASGIGALFEMITGPAGRAGLSFEDGLVTRLLEDTGTEPGALALLAFALHELYEGRTADRRLTHAAYDSFGGVKGAIAQRAEETFKSLELLAPDVQQTLNAVFQELVEVDERGVATRRRAARRQVSRSLAIERLIDRFTNARLLVTTGKNEPTVEVAHEALLMNWPRLKKWIEDTQEDLRLLSLLRRDAAEWDRNHQEVEYCWPDKRLKQARQMVRLLKPDLTAVEKLFLTAVQNRLVEELNDPTTHF